uniref:Uncharacterized protein n=1 Tax=Anguilla anguilla TaxID=7936 RepID=A0A0E9PX15_ANGAN
MWTAGEELCDSVNGGRGSGFKLSHNYNNNYK